MDANSNHQEDEGPAITNGYQEFDQQDDERQSPQKVEVQNKLEQEEQKPEAQENRTQEKPEMPQKEPPSSESDANKENQREPQAEPIGIVQKHMIIKQAQLQRIAATQDFFSFHMTKYRRHLQARRAVIVNMCTYINQQKVKKAQIIILLKEYFKDYSDICINFHQKSYKNQYPQRQESQSKLVNIRAEMSEGLEKLFSLRRQSGGNVGRLEKVIKSNVLTKIQAAIEKYWKATAKAVEKFTEKKEAFEDGVKDVQKRVEKVGRVYLKGRLGENIKEDVFGQMLKFVREESKLRKSMLDFSKEIVPLRKAIIREDYQLITELQQILSQFKKYNGTVYQLKKRKNNLLQTLKEQIESKYAFEKLCTPLDADYIRSVLAFKNKDTPTLLKQNHFETFLTEQYFDEIVGPSTEFLKGTTTKIFGLANPDQQLVHTVANNLLCYNKKKMEIKFQMVALSTKAQFLGEGKVLLNELEKGVFFDSNNKQIVQFVDNNRAEELLMFLTPDQ